MLAGSQMIMITQFQRSKNPQAMNLVKVVSSDGPHRCLAEANADSCGIATLVSVRVLGKNVFLEVKRPVHNDRGFSSPGS